MQPQTPPSARARTELFQRQLPEEATMGRHEESLLKYLGAGCYIVAQTVLVYTAYASLALGRLGYHGILKTGRYAQENRHILNTAYRATTTRAGGFARQNRDHIIERYRATVQVAHTCKRRLIEFTTRRNADDPNSPVTVLPQSPFRHPSPTRSSHVSPQRRSPHDRTRANPGPLRDSPPHSPPGLASRRSPLPYSRPGATSARLAWDAQLAQQPKPASPPPHKDFAQMVSIHQLMDIAMDETDSSISSENQDRFNHHQSPSSDDGKDMNLDNSLSSSDSITLHGRRSALSDLHSNSKSETSPHPITRLKKSVSFFQSPRTGRPVNKVKTFDRISPSPLSRLLRECRRRSLESYYRDKKPEATLEKDSLNVGDDLKESIDEEMIESEDSFEEPKRQETPEKFETDDCSEQLKRELKESSEDSQNESEGDSKFKDELGITGDGTVDNIHVIKREEKVKLERNATSPTTPSTPIALTPSLDRLTISTRRTSERQRILEREIALRRAEEEARLAAEVARKEAAAAAAQAKREAAAARQAELRTEADWKKRGSRRKPTFPLITPLSPDWDAKVDAAMATISFSTALATSSDGTNISRKDFGTLLPQPGRDSQSAWLNDEVLCAYLQMIVQHGLSRTGHKRGQTPKYHAFNTFFYSSLRDGGPEKIKRWAGRAKLGGASLLSTEYIFVPVHQSSHWTLLVISPARRTIEYFDSFHGSGRRFTDNIKAWLAQELGDKWVEKEWSVYDNAGSPTQQNARDCGVFAATTARMVMLGWEPEASYREADIGCQRRRMAAELMNGGFTGDFEPIMADDE